MGVPMATTDSERIGLRRIRTRRRIVWITLAAFLPLVAMAYALAGSTVMNVTGFVLMGIWGLAIVISGFARCPRCKGVFALHSGIANPWRQACGNCGLSLDEAR